MEESAMIWCVRQFGSFLAGAIHLGAIGAGEEEVRNP
jgi:hypothetical protein